MNTSGALTLTQVPLVNSTQIITQSTQVPQVSQVPTVSVVVPTPVTPQPVEVKTQSVQPNPVVSQVPLVVDQTPIISLVPVTPVPAPQPVQVSYTLPVPTLNEHFENKSVNTLYDVEYRLGRPILDDFRPDNIKSQYGIVVNTPNVVGTTSVAVPTNGANTLKEFL